MTHIIMYHYVRDYNQTDFKNIKGISVELFEAHIQYLLKHYKILQMEDIIEACLYNKHIDKNTALLTFDDGYTDHLEYVLPILKKYQLQGSFFPPVTTAKQETVLDVNLIHHILAKTGDIIKLKNILLGKIDFYRDSYDLKSNEFYFSHYLKPNRYDDADTNFVKRMLQRGLPETLRRQLCIEFLEIIVGLTPQELAKKLYMSSEQIQYMISQNMFFGAHCYTHPWMSTLSQSEIEHEIDESLVFLKRVGAEIDNWVMCYPYGDYNTQVINVLKNKNCAVGLTVEPKQAYCNQDNRFIMPRFDANDVTAWIEDTSMDVL